MVDHPTSAGQHLRGITQKPPTGLFFHFSLSQMKGGTITATIISGTGSQTPHFGSSCPIVNLCLVSEHKSGLMECSWEFLGRRHPLPARGPGARCHCVRPTALIKFQQAALGLCFANARFITVSLGSPPPPLPAWCLLSHCFASDPSFIHSSPKIWDLCVCPAQSPRDTW